MVNCGDDAHAVCHQLPAIALSLLSNPSSLKRRRRHAQRFRQNYKAAEQMKMRFIDAGNTN